MGDKDCVEREANGQAFGNTREYRTLGGILHRTPRLVLVVASPRCRCGPGGCDEGQAETQTPSLSEEVADPGATGGGFPGGSASLRTRAFRGAFRRRFERERH